MGILRQSISRGEVQTEQYPLGDEKRSGGVAAGLLDNDTDLDANTLASATTPLQFLTSCFLYRAVN